MTTYVKVARDDPPPFELQGYKPGTTLEGMLFPATYEVRPEDQGLGRSSRTSSTAFDDQLRAKST